MAKPTKTFPVLSKADRAEFDLLLQAEFGVKVLRPNLVSAMLGGMNGKPIVPAGKVDSNKAWRALHVSEAFVYSDESTRKRKGGGSQVETVRAAIVKIEACFNGRPKDHPQGATRSFGTFDRSWVKLTGGENGTVEIWRVA